MTIRLIQDVPVSPKHGMTKGRELATVKRPLKEGVWVLGDKDEEVRIMSNEYEVLIP